MARARAADAPASHRANDTDARGRPVADKNERSTEWWDGIYASARASVAAFGQRAVLMRRFQEAAAAEFDDGFFDCIYIDAGHTYEHVYRDLRLWWPKLRPGGLLAVATTLRTRSTCSPASSRRTTTSLLTTGA